MPRPALLLTCALLSAASAAGCAHRPWENPSSDWKRVRSEHFLVHTDAGSGDYQPIIDTLEDVHASLSSTFFQGVQVPRAEVLLFSSPRDFRGVATKEVGGFFTYAIGSGEGIMVFSSNGDPEGVVGLAAHELTHKFISALRRWVPAWLNEGFANYIGASKLDDDLVIFDMAPLQGWQVYFDQLVPLDQLFAEQSTDFYQNRGAHYLTAWMLMRQILAAPGGGTPPERWRKMVDRISESHTPAGQAAAVSEAAGVPIPALDGQLREIYESVYSGMNRQVARKTMGLRYVRPQRGPLQIEPGDRALVLKWCQKLRADLKR
jgi:hypothetical protein